MKMPSFSIQISRCLPAAIVFLCFFGFAAYGQKDWTGEIPSVDIEIVETRELTLPPANRNFEKIPPRASEPIKPPIRYDFQAFNFSAPPVSPVIRPLKLKPASPGTIYGGFLRLGYGNYGSPLLEGYITSRKDKDKLIGAHLYHSSSAKGPVDGKNSGSGTTKAALFGRTFSQSVAFSGRIDAENRATHFYGYPDELEVDASDIRQAYNLFRISGDVSNARNTDFSYKLGAQVSYLADKFDARETEADIIFESGYKTGDDSGFNIDASYTALSRKDIDVSSKLRNLFTVSPSYTFAVENLVIKLGLAIAYENDTLNKDFHIYPNVRATYPLSPSVDLVAALEGGMEKVSLATLSYKNIWLAPNVPLAHLSKLYDLSAAINARVGNKVGVHAGFSMSASKNMHFFVNRMNTVERPWGQAQFDVIYSDGTFYRTNLFGSLSYAQSEKVKLSLRGDVYTYALGKDEIVGEPWHLPGYKLSASASFNVADKLLVSADIIGMGGLKGRDPETGDVIKLDGALDVSAKAEYLFSQSFSIFGQFNNIVGNNYPLFLYYPVRGFQFTAGITWSF